MKYIIQFLLLSQSCICHQLYKDDIEKNKVKLNVQSVFINYAAGRYSLYDKNEWFKDKKYDESVLKVIARACADFVTEDNEFKDHKNKEIITFNVEPTTQCYTQSNFNALYFYNYIKNSFVFDGINVNIGRCVHKKTMDKLIKYYASVADIKTHIKTSQQQIKQYLEVFWEHNNFQYELLDIMRGNKKCICNYDNNDTYTYSKTYEMYGQKYNYKWHSYEIKCSIKLEYDRKYLKSVKLGTMEEILINKSVNKIDNLYDLLNEYNIKHNIIEYNGLTLLKSYENKYDKKNQAITITDDPYEIVFKGAEDTDNPFLEFAGNYQCDILTINTKKIYLKDIKNNKNNVQKIRLVIPEKTYGHRTKLRCACPTNLVNYKNFTAEAYIEHYSSNKGSFTNLLNHDEDCLQYEIEIKFDGEVYFPSDLSYFFRGDAFDSNAITKIDMKDVKWPEEENVPVAGMFYQCSNLTEIVFPDKGKLKCSCMNNMFDGCKKLLKLDVGSFDTKEATDMSRMFQDCHSLHLIKHLENFDTQNVYYMHQMFNNCYSLPYIDIQNFSFTNLKSIGFMFNGCRSLTQIKANNQKFTHELKRTWDTYHRISVYTDCISLSTYPSIRAIDPTNGKDVTKEVFLNDESNNVPNLLF